MSRTKHRRNVPATKASRKQLQKATLPKPRRERQPTLHFPVSDALALTTFEGLSFDYGQAQSASEGTLNQWFVTESCDIAEITSDGEVAEIASEDRTVVPTSGLQNNNLPKLSLESTFLGSKVSAARMNITSAIGLESVNHVQFFSCASLVDVSALRNAAHVSIADCPNVDLSSLSNVKTLRLIAVHISDATLAALGNVSNLTFSKCYFESSTPVITAKKQLALIHCRGIREVSLIGDVERVKIQSKCNGFKTLNVLGTIKKLQCPSIIEVKNREKVAKFEENSSDV